MKWYKCRSVLHFPGSQWEIPLSGSFPRGVGSGNGNGKSQKVVFSPLGTRCLLEAVVNLDFSRARVVNVYTANTDSALVGEGTRT